MTSGQWCSSSSSLVVFKGLLTREIKAAHLKGNKRLTGENDPYLCYSNNFLTGLTFSGLSNCVSSNWLSLKTLWYITSLICLYTTLWPKESSSNSLLWHSRFSNIRSTSASAKLNIQFFFSAFLTLHLLGKSSPSLLTCLSLCFPPYKSFNTFLYHLPSLWLSTISLSYVEVP